MMVNNHNQVRIVDKINTVMQDISIVSTTLTTTSSVFINGTVGN